MRKWLIVAAFLAAPVTGEAQITFYESVPFGEIQVSLFDGRNTLSRGVRLRFRNTADYDASSFHSIGGVYSTFSDAYLGLCGSECNIAAIDALPRAVGPIDTSPMPGPFGIPMNLDQWYYESSATGGYGRTKGPFADGGITSGFGLVGCSMPYNAALPEGGPYWTAAPSGRNCLRDGFDGWYEMDFMIQLATVEDATAFTLGDVEFRLRGTRVFGPVVVSEPSAFLLIGTGLLAVLTLLGAKSRARRRVTALR